MELQHRQSDRHRDQDRRDGVDRDDAVVVTAGGFRFKGGDALRLHLNEGFGGTQPQAQITHGQDRHAGGRIA